jgi:hypothetical protein
MSVSFYPHTLSGSNGITTEIVVVLLVIFSMAMIAVVLFQCGCGVGVLGMSVAGPAAMKGSTVVRRPNARGRRGEFKSHLRRRSTGTESTVDSP